MKELQELRNYILELKNMGVIKKTTEITLLHKLNALEKQFAISGVSNCGDKHLSRICDKEGHQMSELWYVNEDRIPFQLEHSDKCCICGYEDNSI